MSRTDAHITNHVDAFGYVVTILAEQRADNRERRRKHSRSVEAALQPQSCNDQAARLHRPGLGVQVRRRDYCKPPR